MNDDTMVDLVDMLVNSYRDDGLAYRVSAKLKEVGDCWEWNAGCSGDRRPSIKVGRRVVYVARLVLAASLGRPIRPRMVAAHKCDNALCVRPSHLYEATYGRNLSDAWYRNRRSRPTTFTNTAEFVRDPTR